MNIPGTARQGDTWEWADNAQFDPLNNPLTPPIYTLHYAIRGPQKLTLDGAISLTGGGWTFVATSAQTETMTAGVYGWTAYADSAAGDRYTVGAGSITVLPDLVAQPAGVDNRTVEKQIVDQITAAIAAGQMVVEYTITGRTVRREGIKDMLGALDYFKSIVSRQIRKSRVQQGLGDPRKSYAIFRPPGGYF